jgi:hypothetical protein
MGEVRDTFFGEGGIENNCIRMFPLAHLIMIV